MATYDSFSDGRGGVDGRLGLIIGGVCAAGFLICFWIVVSALMTHGHAIYNTTSDGVMWGVPIVTYDFFMLLSVGIAAIASLSLAFGIGLFRPVVGHALWMALACVTAGGVSLFLELGYPLRAMLMILPSFAIASPLWWKVLFVFIYVPVLVALLWREQHSAHREKDWLGVTLFLTAVLLALTSGSVYGAMSMRPFWFGGHVQVAFLVESAVAGFALAMLLSGGNASETGRVASRFFGFALGLHLAMVASRTLTGLYANLEGLQVWDKILSQPWIYIEVILCIALPLAILASKLRENNALLAAAGVLALIGLYIGHYEFIVGGQLVPLFKGAWVDGLIPYTPSFHEWMLAPLSAFLVGAVYFIGTGVMRLDPVSAREG